MAQVDPAVASAAAANDGTAELAAATAAVLPRDLPQRPCAVIDELLSVIGAEPLLRSLNHAGRAGVARWSQTRVEAARSVLLDQLGFDGARVERASRNLESAARAALEGGGGVGIKNARFKMLVRLVPRSEQKRLDLGYARARARESRVSRRRSDARFSPSSSRAAATTSATRARRPSLRSSPTPASRTSTSSTRARAL